MHILILPSWYSNPLHPMQGSFFRDQALALSKAGVKVGIIAPHQRSITTLKHGRLFDYNYKIEPVEIDNGIPVIKSYGWGAASLKNINILIYFFQLNRLYKRYVKQFGRPDLIHVHSAIWAGLAAMKLSKKHNVPYIITEHFSRFVTGQIAEWQAPYLKECFLGASKVIAVSSFLANQIKPYVGYLDVKVIPNVVDVSYFTLPPKSRGLIRSYTILCVANLVPIKGIDILVKAFFKAFSEDPNVFLEIAGEREQRQYLENLVNELGCSKRITFLGLLNKDEVRIAMWRSHLFVLSSYSETFGVVLIEALSTGLNVLSTFCGGTNEIVTPELGLLVEPGGIDELALALKKTKSNYSWDEGKEKLMRNHIKEKYAETIISEQLIDVYKAAIISK